MPAQRGAAVLAVTNSEQDRAVLGRIFTGAGWSFHHAEDCRAAALLIAEFGIPVVVCDAELVCGCWKDLKDRLGEADAPALIVASRAADDRLWAEVLNLGGFDVLAKPFERQEVLWAARIAWEEWLGRGLRRAASGGAGA